MMINHKADCSANMACAVLHQDGPCPNKSKCDCGAEKEKKNLPDKIETEVVVGDPSNNIVRGLTRAEEKINEVIDYLQELTKQ